MVSSCRYAELAALLEALRKAKAELAQSPPHIRFTAISHRTAKSEANGIEVTGSGMIQQSDADFAAALWKRRRQHNCILTSIKPVWQNSIRCRLSLATDDQRQSY